MARLYTDEDFPMPVVEELRRLGHDVRTAQETGRANQQLNDSDVLSDAIADRRAILTHNHADFRRLHRQGIAHLGIISCTQDHYDPKGLAQRIDVALLGMPDLANKFVRVVKPNPPPKP
jgi:hypothetical protein